MAYKLIGYKKVDMKNQNGEFHGYSLYFTQQIRNGAGEEFVVSPSKRSTVSLTDEEFKSLAPEVGEEYMFSYTRFGSVDKHTLELV